MAKGMGNLLKQAQQMQAKMAKIQEEVGAKTVEATAGGGMVTVVANGKQEIISIAIEPQVVDPDDIEMLQDLVVAAANKALKEAGEMMAAELGKVTGGIKVPGLTL
ncbi:MAG: YbaB/EbfC family nucleoid-associated protein [Deltaproteobacteria bacterium]|nr:YbaB/EbfC family nucleoid-associated protein [Candidatus Anaeroferrophillus wilburensis]MBN2888683.1 YbaB/EbfC family nucleoid-associated protein [Deltaproteobacteria bacterium]